MKEGARALPLREWEDRPVCLLPRRWEKSSHGHGQDGAAGGEDVPEGCTEGAGLGVGFGFFLPLLFFNV